MRIVELLQKSYLARRESISEDKMTELFADYLKKENIASPKEKKSPDAKAAKWSICITLFPVGKTYYEELTATCLKHFAGRLITCKKIHPAALAAALQMMCEWTDGDYVSCFNEADQNFQVAYEPGIVENMTQFLQTGILPARRIFHLDRDCLTRINDLKKQILSTKLLYQSRTARNHYVETQLNFITGWHFELDRNMIAEDFLGKLCNRNDPDISESIINDKIKAAIQEYPIYDYLFARQKLNELSDYLALNCLIRVTQKKRLMTPEIIIHPSLTRFFDDISQKWDSSKEASESCYSRADLFIVLGQLALIASSHLYKEVNPADHYSVPIEGNSFYEEHRELLNLAVRVGLLTIYNGRIAFIHKHYRIIFAAMEKAALDNRMPKWENTNCGIENYREDSITSGQLFHYQKRYNWATVYFTVYAEFLTTEKMEEFFRFLEGLALDYRTGVNDAGYDRRTLQMKAIQIISYYLYAGAPLPMSWESELFQTAFAENLYPMQAILISEFLNKRKYYRRLARETFEKSCRIRNGSAEGQPYYIFLQCLVTEELPGTDPLSAAKNFFFHASLAHDYSWRKLRLQTRGFPTIEQMCENIKQAGRLLKAWYEREYLPQKEGLQIRTSAESVPEISEDTLMWYVYGINLYGYVFGNLLLNQSENLQGRKLASMLEENPLLSGEITGAMIYADYFCRKTNSKYNRGEHGREHEPVDKMFMLCGPDRFFCQYHNTDHRIPLTGPMRTDYRAWLKMENGKNFRYSFLMLSTLSHTDLDYEDLIPGRKEYQTADFLEYDEMDAEYEDMRARLLQR